MNQIKRIIAIMMLIVTVAFVMTSCVFRVGVVSRDDWRRAVNLPDTLSGYTQTAYSTEGELLYSFTVKFDKTTLYRTEKGADGLTDYELYIQYGNMEYVQYRNVYSEDGEPGTWKKSKATSDDWDYYISFLYGLDEYYGLEEFICYDDYTYDFQKGAYYADEIPVMYDGAYFTDVTVRFENKRLIEFNCTQNLNKAKLMLEQTFEYDGGELDVPADILQ